MTEQDVADMVGERIMCPRVAVMERAWLAEQRARAREDVARFGRTIAERGDETVIQS